MALSSRKSLIVVFVTLICVVSLSCPLALSSTRGTNPFQSKYAYASSSENFQSRFGVASSHLPLWDTSIINSQLNAAQDAGTAWIRTGIMWCDMEPVEGSWNYSKSDYAINAAYTRGIKVIGILGGPPGWANNTNPTNPFYPPTDIEAWQNYVTKVCDRYKGKVQAWEIWNEENIGFWQPSPNAGDYVALLSQTTPFIKAVDREATVVMGGVAGLGSDFLADCLKAGAAEYIDAISYHPYTWTLSLNNYQPQEVYCRQLVEWVRGLISQYTKKDIGIWLTELGWTTCTTIPPGVDVNTQAAYLLRSFISYATTEVDRVIWYNMWNENNNAASSESNWGLLNNDFSPKPSYKYYQCFNDTLGDCTGVMQNTLSNISCTNKSTLELYAFNKPDGSVIVTAWKTDDANDQINFTLSSGDLQDPVSIDPLTGGTSSISGVSRSGNAISVTGLTTGKTPVILKFETSKPQIDSLGNYSKIAGGPGFILTVNGSGFNSSSILMWNGSPRTTHYSSSAKLTADITKADISKAGTYYVTVQDSPPFGATSNPVAFTVDNWINNLIKQFWTSWYSWIKLLQRLLNPWAS